LSHQTLRGAPVKRIHSYLIGAFLSLLFSAIVTEASDKTLEKTLQDYLGQSQAILEQMGEKLRSGSRITDQLANLNRLVEEIMASHPRMMEQFRLREEKVGAHGAKALERHRAMSEGYRKGVEECLSLLEDLLRQKRLTLTTIDRLKASMTSRCSQSAPSIRSQRQQVQVASSLHQAQ